MLKCQKEKKIVKIEEIIFFISLRTANNDKQMNQDDRNISWEFFTIQKFNCINYS